MALQLAITDNKGITAIYHRITSVAQLYEPSNEGIHIGLAGYISREYREKEIIVNEGEYFQPNTIITNTTIRLPFNETEDFTRATLYTRLKNEVENLSLSQDV